MAQGITKQQEHDDASTESKAPPRRRNTCNQWMIDKLFNAGVIDQEQHFAGVHIRFWRECAISSHLKALSVESIRGGAGDMDGLNAQRLDAKSLMSKIIIAMRDREHAEARAMLWAPCVWIAIDDLTISHAIAKMGKRRQTGFQHVQYAFTALYEELERNELLFWQRDPR